MKKRIWELDALRGICVLGMVLVHLLYDASVLFDFSNANANPVFILVADYGSIFFLVISGICVTFSRNSIKRGLLVFACGLICSAVTAGIYFLDIMGEGIIIYFGVLHCLGVCMMLWALCKRLPTWLLTVLGIVIVATGYHLMENVRVDSPYLFPFGLMPRNFATADYFPLLPHFGYFLLGAVLGKTVYKNKQSLLPKVNEENAVLRFFRFCGKHSLIIYLGHQPVLTGLFYLFTTLKN